MSFPTVGQEAFTLLGRVTDATTGEGLAGTTIMIDSTRSGTVTDANGRYSLTIASGQHSIVYRYIGYRTQRIRLLITGDKEQNVKLEPAIEKLEEIVVSGNIRQRKVQTTEMGVEKITTKQLQSIPVIFGEKDILKSIQLLPGISPVGEGNSGFYVRGGDASQNLILLDGATIYNASHLLGFFSVFNSNAVEDVEMMKGSIPARYGGRLSSVLDIKMKEGNNKKLVTSGGIGLISSNAQVEGPLAKKKGSFLVSGRRTYADLFLKFLSDTNLNSNVLYFYDLNATANFRVNTRDRLFFSGYLGRDIFKFRKTFGFNWGNKSVTLRWNHVFSSRFFFNSILTHSKYDYKFNFNYDEGTFNLTSAISDFGWKEDFQYALGSGNNLRFGTRVTYHKFLPGEIDVSGNFPVNNTRIEDRYALESAAYVSHETRLGKVIKLNYGIRLAAFTSLGPGSVFSFDNLGNPVDTLTYQRLENIVTYPSIDPRLTINFSLSEKSSLKGAYVRLHQYLHLLSNTTSATPIDLWVPSSKIIKPQVSNQFSLGYYRDLDRGNYELSVEGYYRAMDHQIDYKNGADIFLNELVESQIVFGVGQAYGAEFSFRKNTGRWHGWISYSLARTTRKFKKINNGKPFSARQDRRHDLSLVGIWNINHKWSLSAVWIYYTGDAITFPSGKYMIENQYVNYYTERNGYRMPDYHRLDLGITYTSDKKKRWESGWNFSLYNVYGRKNAYSISFQADEDNPEKMKAVKLYLFSVIPSVTYNFKF